MDQSAKPKGADAPKATESADPLAGKSATERKATLEAAAVTDKAAEATPEAKAKAMAELIKAKRARRKLGLVVTEASKTKAYALLRRLEDETATWRAAKAVAKPSDEKVAALRAKKKLTQRELNGMRGEDCDSVQAAENDRSAELEVERAEVEAVEAGARAIVAAEKFEALKTLAAKA